MPKIGLRNIKTAISVFICIMIYVIIILIANLFLHDLKEAIKIGTESYTPFFACIATAYSIGPDKSKSFAQAKLRIISSIIGGLFGILVLAIYIHACNFVWPFSYISATGNPTNNFTGDNFTWGFILSFIPATIIIGLSSIVVVWLCNLLKQKSSSFIAVLTLTAVMSSLGTSPLIYGVNRIFSTIIGVLVALGVNLFTVPRYKDSKKLFVVSMDGIYLEDNAQINGFHSYKVNQLIAKGANLTYFSTRTPMGLIPMTNDVNLKLPVICLSGAALYDLNTKEYLYKENLDQDVAKKILDLLENINVNPFVNCIYDNVLYTFNKSPQNECELNYCLERKNSANGSYLTGTKPDDMDICYFVIAEKDERIKLIINEFKKHKDIMDNIVYYEYDSYSISDIKATEGYKYFKIYSKKVLELNALKELNKNNEFEIYSCGTHQYDTNLFKHSKYSFTDIDSIEELKDASTNILKTTKDEKIFKEIDKLYHKKSID